MALTPALHRLSVGRRPPEQPEEVISHHGGHALGDELWAAGHAQPSDQRIEEPFFVDASRTVVAVRMRCGKYRRVDRRAAEAAMPSAIRPLLLSLAAHALVLATSRLLHSPPFAVPCAHGA
ncbi:MAG TPA: hypothetical protein VK428_12040 [Acidimicrobiales bacterium]|nr:hypothetical protein [Acidimicrobiales bacterium]